MQTIEINKIPALTWNWMKMNKGSISDEFDFSVKEPAIQSNTNIQISKEGLITSLPFSVSANGKQIEDIISQIVKNPQYIELSKENTEPIIFNFEYDENEKSATSQIIHAQKDTNATLIYLYTSKNQECFSAIQTKVYLEENAFVHIIKVQLLGANATQSDDTSFVCGENAKAKFTQIELGAKNVFSGLHTTLYGYKSDFVSNVGYLCKDSQNLDMNHVVIHNGQKSTCNMNVNGTVKDEAVKVYRGTIDFKNGCKGAKGNEMEETLLLSPKVVNKSIPIILCDEEDVEGEHGCTIGKLSSDILFYMQTRVISETEIKKLMTKAKIMAVSDEIPNQEIKDKIEDFINKAI